MQLLAALPILILLLQQAGAPASKAPPTDPKFAIKLLPAAESIQPGGEIELAVEFDIEKGWHVYHPIILDTGLPTRIKFTGPAGLAIRDNELRYPVPELGSTKIDEYLEFSGKFRVLATLQVDKTVAVGKALTIRADASALICQEACVLVDANATISIPVTTERGKPAKEKLFEEARDALPKPIGAAPYIKGSAIALSKSTLSPGESAEIIATIKVEKAHHIQDRDPGVEGLIPSRFFVESLEGVEVAPSKEHVWPDAKTRDMPGLGKVREQGGEFKVRIPIKLTDDKLASGPIRMRVLFQYQCCTDAGVCYPPEMAEATVVLDAKTLVPDDGKRALYVASTSAAGASPSAQAPVTATGSGSAMDLFYYLLLGLVGGLLLNVMPCVLPVISIKVISFVKQGGEDPGRVLRLSLVFALGVLAWFWLLAGITGLGSLQLRSQFQNPLQNANVVFILATVVFAMALNLFGVFEFVLPGSTASRLDDAARKEGYPGAFAKGFLATLLGTACSAPFITPALAWAVTQPIVVSFLVFTVAGLGMALPYIVLAANPGWLRFVPKPGMWMVNFKQAMGFVLVATAIYLLWGLRKHWGADGIVVTVAFWAFLGGACWLIGKARPTWRVQSVYATWTAAVLVACAGYWVSFRWMYDVHKPHIAAAGSATTAVTDEELDRIATSVADASWDRIPWIPYRPGLAEAFSKRGYAVYVDYTADWCPSCKTNLLVLETDGIRTQMKRLGIIPIEADFTVNDPDIRRDIEADGKLSVPVNRVYAPGSGRYAVLPNILTPGNVSEELDKAGPSTAKRNLALAPDAAQPSNPN